MAGEVIVREDVSRCGLWRVHAVRTGGPVDVEGLLEARGVGREEAMVLVYEEEGLGVHHARVYWREELNHRWTQMNTDNWKPDNCY